jgi:hypothetical protein
MRTEKAVDPRRKRYQESKKKGQDPGDIFTPDEKTTHDPMIRGAMNLIRKKGK